MATKPATPRVEIRVLPFHVRRHGRGSTYWDVLGGWRVTFKVPAVYDAAFPAGSKEFPLHKRARKSKSDKAPTAKKQAVAHARSLGRTWWNDGVPAQVTIHDRRGRVQTEHTYGRDPERTPG
jgi:hypothetical protein